jgi:hypothetical protein
LFNCPPFGSLNPEQIYSSMDPTISENIKQLGNISFASHSVMASGRSSLSNSWWF